MISDDSLPTAIALELFYIFTSPVMCGLCRDLSAKALGADAESPSLRKGLPSVGIH